MSDILNTIDATVDGLCACGCGRQLTSDGPSGWWATQHCQQRFQERNATNPGEVRRRPDAAAVFVRDSARVPLSEPPTLPGGWLDRPAEFRLIHNTLVTTYRYSELSPGEQEKLHRWLELHDITPGDVPLDATIRINGAWRVEVDTYDWNAVGGRYLNDAGEVARTSARRRLIAPWPLATDLHNPVAERQESWGEHWTEVMRLLARWGFAGPGQPSVLASQGAEMAAAIDRRRHAAGGRGHSGGLVILDEIQSWLDAGGAEGLEALAATALAAIPDLDPEPPPPGRLWAQWLAGERIAAGIASRQRPARDWFRITGTGA